MPWTSTTLLNLSTRSKCSRRLWWSWTATHCQRKPRLSKTDSISELLPFDGKMDTTVSPSCFGIWTIAAFSVGLLEPVTCMFCDGPLPSVVYFFFLFFSQGHVPFSFKCQHLSDVFNRPLTVYPIFKFGGDFWILHILNWLIVVVGKQAITLNCITLFSKPNVVFKHKIYICQDNNGCYMCPFLLLRNCKCNVFCTYFARHSCISLAV